MKTIPALPLTEVNIPARPVFIEGSDETTEAYVEYLGDLLGLAAAALRGAPLYRMNRGIRALIVQIEATVGVTPKRMPRS